MFFFCSHLNQDLIVEITIQKLSNKRLKVEANKQMIETVRRTERKSDYWQNEKQKNTKRK